MTAARTIAAEEGLDRLTIRALALRLDVAPNAIYGWVASKAALLDALVDDASTGLVKPGTGDAAAELRTLLLDTFDVLVARPELAPLLIDRAASPGPNATLVRDRVHGLLEQLGMDAHTTAIGVPVLLVHALGFTAFVGQSHHAPLLDEQRLGSPRNVFAAGLDWLLTGMHQSSTKPTV